MPIRSVPRQHLSQKTKCNASELRAGVAAYHLITGDFIIITNVKIQVTPSQPLRGHFSIVFKNKDIFLTSERTMAYKLYNAASD